MTNGAMERSLLESLNAYVKHFETPNIHEDVLAIANSILTFQQEQVSIAIATHSIFIDTICEIV